MEKDTQMSSRKIPYAMYSDNWTYSIENYAELLKNYEAVTSNEYIHDVMYEKIFCPKCFTPLTRTPLVESRSRNNVLAYFKHLPSYSHINCMYRANKGEGLNYVNEEEAKEAVDNEQLVVIDSFMKEVPEVKNVDDDEDCYDSLIEDIDGPTTDVSISRHTGEKFSLPSKVTSVRAICRNFSKNLHKGYYLPNSNIALPLSDLLNDLSDIKAEDNDSKLYIGKITRSDHQGKEKRDNNIRMTFLSFKKGGGYADFCIKEEHSLQAKHKINDNSVGRYVIFYGKIEESGVGLCVTDLSYGELSLLPKKYNTIVQKLYDL